MLFIGGLVALLILLANLGPMVILGLSVWLLYIIFKKFIKSDSAAGKVGWVILGLLVLSVTFSNMFAIVGLAAAYALYLVVKNWKNVEEDPAVDVVSEDNDPFTNFERQWAEINQ